MPLTQAKKIRGRERCLIIGAGPAGLTAAYELSDTDVEPFVLEQDNVIGGIARTAKYGGYRFDIGGHRFFSKSSLINDWWENILGEEFLVRSRMSRIYYNNKFFDYPLKPLNALNNLGFLESLRIAASYISARVVPYREENNLEEWLTNRFGRRLYEIFFKSYTEKVWGMQCTEIGADWAAQRIKNLDLKSAIRNMFLGNAGNRITSLIEEFRYPRLGPGMMWEHVAEILSDRGYSVRLGHKVTGVHLSSGEFASVTLVDDKGETVREYGDHLITSMPMRDLVKAFDPAAPRDVVEAADRLRYRDFLTVGLIVDISHIFPDNWIYVHSPEVKVGRIQNFKNWSPDMVPNSHTSAVGLEYFVQADDDMWNAADDELIELAADECSKLGLFGKRDVLDGVVIRSAKAYPVYDQSYRESVATIRRYLDTIPNLQLVGRNGQHRYNNQDHSMLTGIYAARNICGASYDVWDVNVDGEYSEEMKQAPSGGATGQRLVPQVIDLNPVDVVRRAFALYDPMALGCALSIVSGTIMFCATAGLLLQGGDVVGPHLSLLGNYLWGYSVTWIGAFLGFAEAATGGFLVGLVMANTINAVIGWHRRRLIKRLENIQLLTHPQPEEPQ